MESRKRILDDHGIKWKVENNRLFAKDEYTLHGVYGWDWLDVTELSDRDFWCWLGY